MRMLEQVNPEGRAKLKTAEANAVFAAAPVRNHSTMATTPFAPVAPFSPAALPPRPWLYGRGYIAGVVSLLVASGGTGKSALAMVEAVAMVTGRELLAGEKPHRKLRVWFHNAEDSQDEMLRRLAATMKHHSIQHAELGDGLFITSGRDMDLTLARLEEKGRPIIVPGVVDDIVVRLKEYKINVLLLDPLGALHTLPENSNEAINLLMGALREIAERANVAVVLVHHTSKSAAMDMAGVGAAASRGASALVDAARVVRQMAAMTEKEAREFGVCVDTRRQYVRVDNGKANLAPAENARWLRLVNVPLENRTQDYPDGDHVQAVERWEPPTQGPKLSIAQIVDIQTALTAAGENERRVSSRAKVGLDILSRRFWGSISVCTAPNRRIERPNKFSHVTKSPELLLRGSNRAGCDKPKKKVQTGSFTLASVRVTPLPLPQMRLEPGKRTVFQAPRPPLRSRVQMFDAARLICPLFGLGLCMRRRHNPCLRTPPHVTAASGTSRPARAGPCQSPGKALRRQWIHLGRLYRRRRVLRGIRPPPCEEKPPGTGQNPSLKLNANRRTCSASRVCINSKGTYHV